MHDMLTVMDTEQRTLLPVTRQLDDLCATQRQANTAAFAEQSALILDSIIGQTLVTRDNGNADKWYPIFRKIIAFRHFPNYALNVIIEEISLNNRGIPTLTLTEESFYNPAPLCPSFTLRWTPCSTGEYNDARDAVLSELSTGKQFLAYLSGPLNV